MRRIAPPPVRPETVAAVVEEVRDAVLALTTARQLHGDVCAAWLAIEKTLGVARPSSAPALETDDQHLERADQWARLACFLLLAKHWFSGNGAARASMQEAMRLTRRGVAVMEQQAASTPETAAAWSRLAECIHTPRVRDAGPPREASPLEWIQALSNFFEHLLAACSSQQRRTLGAFYTPFPLAQYVAQGAELLLRRALGANTPGEQPTRVRWLDPACGSGVFLATCAPLLRDSNLPAQAWLEGWDLSPASCCAAQVLTCLAEGRAEVSHRDGLTQSILPDNHVHACVVLGNPPYGNFGQNKTNPWMQQLLQRYKNAGQERKCNLNDTAIQFLRWAEHHLHAQTAGVLALVLNNTFLDGVTHGRVRQSLMETFAQIFVLDLHGSSIKRETQAVPRGHRKDENVFVAVRQGVCVLFAVKGPGVPARESGLWRYDLRGSRLDKLSFLQSTRFADTPWRFVRRNISNAVFRRRRRPPPDCASLPRLSEIFEHYVSGVQTKCDALFLDQDRDALSVRIRRWLEQGALEQPLPAWLRKRLEADAQQGSIRYCEDFLQAIYTAPWDRRWAYNDARLLGRARETVLKHLLRPNVALAFMRQSANQDGYDHFLAVDAPMTDRGFYSGHGTPYLAPLWLYENGARRANLRPEYLRELFGRIGRGVQDQLAEAREAFAYLYGVVWNPEYRRRFSDALRDDFPRVPWPSSVADWNLHAGWGQRLLELHLPAAPGARSPALHWRRDSTAVVQRPAWDAETGCVLMGRGNTFGPLEADVWRFRCGGYAVLERWLKQRRGKPLDDRVCGDVERIVEIIRCTLRIQGSLVRCVPV